MSIDAATWLNMNRPPEPVRGNPTWEDYIDRLEDEFREREAVAEARVRELEEAIHSALAAYPENRHLHSILERALVPANEETAE